MSLFIGGLPADIEETMLRPVFAPYGELTEVICLPNKSRTGQRCAFVTYAQQEHATAAIDALNGKHKIRPTEDAIIVRFKGESKKPAASAQPPPYPYPYGEAPYGGEYPYAAPWRSDYPPPYPPPPGRPPPPYAPPPYPPPPRPAEKVAGSSMPSETLFIGGLAGEATDELLRGLFSQYGEITDCTVLKNNSRTGQRCAFVSFSAISSAQAAIDALNGIHKMSPDMEPIIVRFKDQQKARVAPPPPAAYAPPPYPPPRDPYGYDRYDPYAPPHHPPPLAPPYGGYVDYGRDYGHPDDMRAPPPHYPPPPMGGGGGTYIPIQHHPPLGPPGQQEPKLFVGGLSLVVTEDALRAVFAPYGEIHSIVLLTPKGTSGQKCAFIIFTSLDAATAALALGGNHKMLPSDPEPIVVRFADRGGNKRKRV